MSTKKNRPSRLGRGLSSLMATPVEVQPPAQTPASAIPSAALDPAEQTGSGADQQGLLHLATGSIQPNRHQPRQRFDPALIRALAESIKSEGVMQPIVVRPEPGSPGQYELIAGERRWRAAQEAGLDQIPALVRELSDEKAAEWALIENLQREDLNPIEKAEAFQRLGDQFGLSHQAIAERVGLERSSVSNLLRLLDLSDFIRDLIREKLLSMGQARAIAGLADASQQKAVAEHAVRDGWSVRQVEAEVQRLQTGAQPTNGKKPSRSNAPALTDLEKQIGEQLGTKVKIKAGRKKGGGTLSIDFYSLDQFDALLSRMDVKTD